MSESGGWHYAGSADVNESANRIGIPDDVFEAGILSKDGDTFWAYESVVGFLIVSNRELENKPKYKPQGERVIGQEGDGYRATIPKPFFADFELMGNPVPEMARVQYGETRHYVYRTEMAEGQTKSCYLLTREQLENTISTPDEWAGSMDSVPRFMQEW